MLLWGREGPDGGRELHVQGVLQLYWRVNVEEAKESACIAWSGMRDNKSRPLNGNSSVSGHFLVAHCKQPLLSSMRRKLLDDQLVVAFKENSNIEGSSMSSCMSEECQV